MVGNYNIALEPAGEILCPCAGRALVGDGGVSNDENSDGIIQWLNLYGTHAGTFIVELDGQLVVPCQGLDGTGLGIPLVRIEFDGVACR